MTRETKLIASIVAMGVVQLITLAFLMNAYGRLDDVSYDLSNVQWSQEEAESSASQLKGKVDELQSDIFALDGRINNVERQSW